MFAKSSDSFDIAIMTEKCEDVVCKDVCISIGPAKILVGVTSRAAELPYVFSSRFTIHFFKSGDSSSENSILDDNKE